MQEHKKIIFFFSIKYSKIAFLGSNCGEVSTCHSPFVRSLGLHFCKMSLPTSVAKAQKILKQKTWPSGSVAIALALSIASDPDRSGMGDHGSETVGPIDRLYPN